MINSLLSSLRLLAAYTTTLYHNLAKVFRLDLRLVTCF